MSNLKNNWINGDVVSAPEVNRVANAVIGLAYNVKTFGAVGDGVVNDAPAIQAAIDAAQVGGSNGGGVVYFPPGKYKLSSTVLIKESNITLQGASIGSTKLYVGSTGNYPAITFTGHLNGVPSTPTTNSTFPWNFSIRDMMIEKGTPVANPYPAISLYCVQMARLHNVHIRGFGVGVLLSASFNVYGHQVHIQSNSAATVSTLYGWKFDSDYANFSSYLSHCTVQFGGENVETVTTYGYYHSGNHPSDWFLDHCEAGACTYGFNYNGSLADTPYDVFDVHFVECVADQCQIGFLIENNLTPGATGGQVDIDSCYWANRYTSVEPVPNSVGVSIINCSGVTVRGFMGWSGNIGDPTRYQNNYGVHVAGSSKDVSITGCNLKGNHVIGIYVNNAAYVTIFGNTILQTMAIGANGISLANGDGVSIVGNTIRSLSGLGTPMAKGINVDASSSSVVIGNNVVDSTTVTTPLSVAGGATARNNSGFADYG